MPTQRAAVVLRYYEGVLMPTLDVLREAFDELESRATAASHDLLLATDTVAPARRPLAGMRAALPIAATATAVAVLAVAVTRHEAAIRTLLSVADLDDRELWARMAAGDAQSLGELFDRHHR